MNKRKSVRTSKDLLDFYPFLEHQAGWSKFAKEFDKPECLKCRSKGVRYITPPKRPEAIEAMLNHCNSVLRGEMLANLPFGLDEEIRFVTPDEVRETRLRDATALAGIVESLLSDSDKGTVLRHAVEAEIKRIRQKKLKPKRSNSVDLFRAFCTFVNREKRLPFKKELNIEANRLKMCKDGFLGEKIFGEIVYRNGAANGSAADRFYVYDCREEYAYDDNDEVQTWKECRIVPWGEWDALRWNPTEYADVSTPSGFKGLPEAHEDKGKVRK